MARFFNTTGPVVRAEHYCIPPLGRFDLPQVLRLIEDGRYFVLHAPRQTGKTTSLLALRDRLNAGVAHRCVYVNVEAAQAAREDVESAMRAILGGLASRASVTLNDRFPTEIWQETLSAHGPHGALAELLTRWSAAADRPLVLFIDEIDALVGDTLLSVLRQLRAGYDQRPSDFPHSLVLCGVRDVRDYRIRSASGGEVVAGGSAFNVKAESLRLGDFTKDDVRELLAQHTAETGQAFTEDALSAVWRRTQGQPWLVNALADQTCFRAPAGLDRSRPITEEAVTEAQEALIQGRQTHLHQLADKLGEARVRRVIEPLLLGEEGGNATPDDLEYARDLGLVTRHGPLRVANPIYREVIPRELLYAREAMIAQQAEWYLGADGGLDVAGLLAAFQRFFREHSEHWIERFEYREAGPQLLLQAFLQRIVNGGGRIEREYGLGRRRTDLLIVWPLPGSASGAEAPRPPQRHVIECKLLRGGLETTIREGVAQTLDYMDRCGAESGHLVVFDRSTDKSWERKLFEREERLDGRSVTVWGA